LKHDYTEFQDNVLIRNGIRSLLEKEPDYEVTGEAIDGLMVLELLDQGIEADIVLADVNMPELSGIKLTSKLKNLTPSCKIIVLSVLDKETYLLQAFQAGAHGYLFKNCKRQRAHLCNQACSCRLTIYLFGA
jgi:DNA-binding NarL/FixJ family response regulator